MARPFSPREAHKASEENRVISNGQIKQLFLDLKKNEKLNVDNEFSLNNGFGFDAGEGGLESINFLEEENKLSFLPQKQIISGEKFGFEGKEVVFDLTEGFKRFDRNDDKDTKECRDKAWGLLKQAAIEVGTSIDKISTPLEKNQKSR